MYFSSLDKIYGEWCSVFHVQRSQTILFVTTPTKRVSPQCNFATFRVIKSIPVKYSASRFKFYAYNKSLCKWGHFEKAKTTFKMLLATWFLVCFFKRFRSFNAKNLGSVGQRAAKLLAVKVGGLKKGLPAGPGPSQPVCPGSNPCAFKSFSKFDGW